MAKAARDRRKVGSTGEGTKTRGGLAPLVPHPPLRLPTRDVSGLGSNGPNLHGVSWNVKPAFGAPPLGCRRTMGLGLFWAFPSAIRQFLAKLTGCIALSSVVLSSALAIVAKPSSSRSGCNVRRASLHALQQATIRLGAGLNRECSANIATLSPIGTSIVLSGAGAVHQVLRVQTRALRHPSRTFTSDRASSSAIDGRHPLDP